MRGLMMDMPLLITNIMRHARTHHPEAEIISVTADTPLHRYTYREAFERVAQLAHALGELGMELGDRIATMAWNDYRHFEVYYASSCAGGICHTVNPRLFAEQLVYIVNHAEDNWFFLDPVFVPLLESIADQLTTVKGFVVMTSASHMPETKLRNVHCYETLLEGKPTAYQWPDLDENTASSLCYTSGTTGNPKGVLYSHRSNVLHTMGSLSGDSLGITSRDTVLPVVPMFHANAWGQPYSAPAVGANLVFPGPKMGDGQALQGLIESEGVTVALGVPTVWLSLLNYLKESGTRVDSLRSTVIGGSACPPVIIKEFKELYDVDVLHAWGMTEMSPIGTMGTFKRGQMSLTGQDWLDLKSKQGRAVFGVELKIVDDNNQELPWDGETFGSLKVRGPWIASGYFKGEGAESFDEDGWFDTGDVATMDPDGFMQITDRAKDVIKSGGEWISSIDLENVGVGHPAVAEAAVISKYHPKWDERPLLVVVAQEGEQVDTAAVLSWFEGKVAKWWIPDDVVVVEELPHTASGKINKRALREQLSDYQLPDAR